MKVDKKALRRMILKEMRASAGAHAQRGNIGPGGRLDYPQLAEADDDDTLAGDLEDIEADLGAAEGDLTDIEDNAMTAIKAIYDLAAAAGVELEADVSGPSDLDVDVDVDVEDDDDVDDIDVEEVLQEISRRRARRILLRKLGR